MARAPGSISLLEVFTAIEGPVESVDCLFGVPRCDGQNCILGKVMAEANQLLVDHLTRTNLKEIRKVFLDGRIVLPFEKGPWNASPPFAALSLKTGGLG